MNKKDNPEKQQWWDKWWLQHVLSITFFVGLIGYIFHDYMSFKGLVLSVYESMETDIETLTFVDENTYTLCKNYSPSVNANKVCPLCVYFHQQEEYRSVISMSEKYSDINKGLWKLGKFFRYGTYVKVRHFTCWQNQLMTSGGQLCESNLLLPPKVLDAWRDSLIRSVDKDRKAFEGVFYSSWKYIVYKFTDTIDEKYPIVDCSLCDTPSERLCEYQKNKLKNRTGRAHK